MKKIILIVLILLFFFGTGVLAQETKLPKAGLTPDSPFYFLERITEAIGTFFTFGDLKKAERHASLAAERLAEAEAISEEKPELIEKTLERYENQLVKSSLKIEKAKTKGKNVEKEARTINEAAHKHFATLEKVLEKAPEEAKPAIRHAMIASTKEGLEVIAETSKEKKEGWLKEFCMEKGPSEMCERIPTQGFKSFEQIEAFCIEMGEPPEQCAGLETKCKEFGVTTPDECLYVLSTAKIETIPVSEKTVKPVEPMEPKQTQIETSQNFKDIETKCLESGGPPEVCASIDKALQGSESSRSFCTKIGGPLEMCEKIPINGFGSFEALESFCAESGGPPEICVSLETKCRELGVTATDDCFRVLSISSVSVSATVSPERHLPEENDCSGGGMYSDGKTKWCCKDSDRSYSPEYVENTLRGHGTDYYHTKGTVEYKIINLTDGTVEEGIETDSCNGNTLTEWMCPTMIDRTTRNERYSEEYNCPLGCANGACIKEEVEEEVEIPTESRGELIIDEGAISYEVEMGGIGIEIGIKNDQLAIMAILKDSSAERADLRIGDKILAIGSAITADLTIDEAVQLISGEIGTNIALLISRDDEEGFKNIGVSIIRTQN